MSDNALSAVNQQGSLPVSYRNDPSETTRRSPSMDMTIGEILAYLHGAMHDASLNKQRRIRFAQKNRNWLVLLQVLLTRIGSRSWIYQEGKTRNVHVLETVCKKLDFGFRPQMLQSDGERKAYLRGFFDAEGGVPHTADRFYIQLVQKNHEKIEYLKQMLKQLGIHSGKVHNPSKKVDPDYWRIFISTADHKKFAEEINSFHPVKHEIFKKRMMI